MKAKLLLLALSLVTLSACGSKPLPDKDKLFIATFSSNGGSHVPSLTCSNVDIEPQTVRDGYQFTGWHINEDLTDNKVTFPYKLINNTTFFASWSYRGYLVTYNTNGGTPIAPEYLGVIENMPTTTKDGYTLKGWTFEDKEISFPYELNKSITIDAIWERNQITPEGELLSSAKVANMESRSYWDFDYQENAIFVHANIVDEVLYSDNSPGYNDNVEIILSPSSASQAAGYNLLSYHFLCDCLGRSYYNTMPNTYSFSNDISILPSGASITARHRFIETDGYNGYSVSFVIPYSLFNMSRSSALNNLYIGIAMRNSNSKTATMWGDMKKGNFSNAWSYLNLKEDNTFAYPDIEVETLFIGDSYFNTGNWASLNLFLSNKNAYVLHDDGNYDFKYIDLDVVDHYKPKKIVTNFGGRDFERGKYSNTEIVGFCSEFVDKLKVLSPEVDVKYISINPIKNFASKLTKIQELNTSIETELDVTFIDTFSLFVNGSTIKTEYYKNNYNLNSDGYSLYESRILTYLE